MEPHRRVASPVFDGMEDVPDSRPLLFVGNHTLYGIFDIPFLFAELYERKGIFLRSLGDHGHFKVPGWRTFLSMFGTVDGTRETCARLMREGECILVFPGGGREVAKRKGERYKLIWKNRLGFARLAIEHGCTIVPFSAVGVEHAFDIVADADDIMRSPLGKLFRRLGIREDIIPPIVRPAGGAALAVPPRLYFRIAPPIRTDEYKGHHTDEATCRALRDRVQAAVQEGIDLLLEKRERDPDRSLTARLLKRRAT
jgi:1-acyl-sn-glycerol-3-phosphate acyltransferase